MDLLLESFKKSVYAKQTEESTRIVLKIGELFDTELPENEYNLYLSKIFDNSNGLLTYPERGLDSKIFSRAIVKIFQLCQILVKNNPKSITAYINQIVHVGRRALNNKHYSRADIRESIIILFIEIFQNGPYQFTNPNIEYELFIQIKRLVGNYNVNNAHVKVEKVFGKLIGVWCQHCSQNLISRFEEIRSFLLLRLRMFLNESKKGDLAIIGYLEGFNYYLKALSDTIKNDESFRSIFYNSLKKILSTSQFQRGVYEAVMKVIKENGPLFAAEITKDEQFCNLKFHQYLETDRKLGVAALSTFYKCLSITLKDSTNPDTQSMFLKYYNQFQKTLLKQRPTTIELRLAIRGFGYFSSACAKQLSPSNVTQMFRLILQKVEVYYIHEITNKTDDNLEFLPEYIQSLSEIIVNLPEISDNELIVLQNMNTLMIKSFPNLPSYYHNDALTSFSQSVTLLKSQRENLIFDKFIENVVYQGVIWTCSHKMAFEVELIDNNNNDITFKNFLPFWQNLLKSEFQTIIIDQLFKTLYKLLEKLDLKTENSVNIETCAANNLTDFKIFLNIVDFYCYIFDALNFDKYAVDFFEKLISLSIKYPLISGFYKLVTSGLCHLNTNIKIDKCSLLLKNFFHQILNKYLEYRDDLFLSMLNMLLSSPLSLLHENLHFLPTVLCSALNIGQTYLNVASKTIDTITKWVNELSHDETVFLLTPVIKEFDKYLKTESKSEINEKLVSKTNKKLINKKIVLKVDPELLQIQQKILMFLGTLDYELRNLIVVDQFESSEIKYAQKILSYNLQFRSNVSVIYLDELLPRILDLVLKSSNRKTRVQACEALHSIIIYLIGKHSQQSDSGRFANIFHMLFSPLLELGCDSDPVIQQLFEPLIKQLIHWITSRSQLKNNESNKFLEIIMDLIVHPTNSNLRVYSAQCLYEFADWSLKQGGNELINIEKIISHITKFAVNPSQCKRYGAALAFNHLIQVLEKNGDVYKKTIDIYWLQFLFCFITSLSYKKADGLSCTNQVIEALDLILREIEKNSRMLNRNEKKRHKPYPFKTATLKDTVLWLFTQCGSKNLIYSQQCQRLFMKLSRYSDNQRSINATIFISEFIDLYGMKHLIKIIDSDIHNLFDKQNIQNTLKWAEHLQIALSAYTWILSNKYITTNKLFQDNYKIIDCIVYFLENILLEKFEVNGDHDQYNLIKDNQELEQLKSEIILNIFDFLNVLQLKLPQLYENQAFLNLVMKCIFESYKLGFTLSHDDLARKLGSLLSVIFIYLHNKTTFCEIINEHLKSNQIKINRFEVNINDMFFIQGIILLKKSEFKNNVNLPDNLSLLNYVYENIIEVRENQTFGIEFPPSVLSYLKFTLEYCWIDFNNQQLIELLNNHYIIIHPITNLQINYNIYFLKLFKNILIERIIQIPPAQIINFDMNIVNGLQFITEILDNLKINHNDYLQLLLKHIALNWTNIENIIQINSQVKEKFLFSLKQIVSGLRNPVDIFKNYNFALSKWFMDQFGVSGGDVSNENMEIFNYQCNILEFLVCLTGPDDEENNHLRDALKYLQTTYINNIATDDLKYTQIYMKLTEAYKQTTSPVILNFIINLTVNENIDHIECENILQNAISWKMANISNQDQLKILNFILKQLKNYQTTDQLKIVQNFLTVFMNYSRKTTIENYFKLNLYEICVNIQTIDKNKPNLFEAIVTNTIILIIIQYLYTLDGEKRKQIVIEDKNMKYSSMKDFNVHILSHCLIATDIDSSDFSETLMKYYTSYVCTAYNTFATIICNVEKNVDMYLPLFYFDKKWSKIIDCNINFVFPQEFDDMPEQKKKIVLVRRIIRKLRNTENITQTPATINYVSTQNLFNSTLEEDVTKFDFFQSVLKNTTAANTPVENSEPSLMNESNIHMKLDILNDNECMPTICALISHLMENLNDNKNVNQLPKWIENGLLPIIDVNNIMTHRNIKLFVIKIIENNSEYLQQYSKWLVGPIMESISTGLIGNDMNYFIAQLILMITEWNVTEYTVEIQSKLTKLLEFLIPRCCHPRSDLYKHYLELLKSIIEVWKSFIILSEDFISSYFLEPKTDTRQIDQQLKISSYLITNEIDLWLNFSQKSRYFNLILNYTKHTEKSIYVLATEILGLFLKTSDQNGEFINKASLNVTIYINEDIYFNKLHAISKSYPLIIDGMMIADMINNKMLGVPGPFKIKILDILIVRLNDCYDQIKINNYDVFENCLNDNDIDIQEKILRVLKTITYQIEVKTIIKIINYLTGFLTHNFVVLRKITYDIMIDFYLRFKQDNNKDLFLIIKEVLIKGLIDKDEQIQIKLFNFWLNEKLNQSTNCSVYDFMLSLYELYCLENEKQFLGQYVWFLFEMISKSIEFKNKIYDSPLRDCNYSDYKIFLQWYEKNASLTPMFINRSTQRTIIGSNESLQILATNQSAFQSVLPSGSASVSNGINISNDDQIEYTKKSKTNTIFLKSQGKMYKNVVLAQQDKKLKEEDKRKVRQKEKDSTVKLYRKYRKGDFPDIEITNEDLIKPLQILAQFDPVISKMLFVSIFNGLMQSRSIESINFVQRIDSENVFTSILEKSTLYLPNLVGALFEIALTNKDHIEIPTDLIAIASQQSGLLTFGCLLLEQKLIDGFPEDNNAPAARRRPGNISSEMDYWLKLAEMYKNLSETDYVHGIFGEKINDPKLKEAFNLEFNNDWYSASEIYKEKADPDNISANTSPILTKFYYASYFNCLKELSSWDQLEKSVQESSNIDDRLWTEDWKKEEILPWIIKIEVHKLCQGKDPSQLFLENLEKWLKNSEQTIYLERNFSEYLILLSIWDNKFEKAKTYATLFERTFLSDWLEIYNKHASLKILKLENLQIFADIKQFLNFYDHLTVDNYRELTEHLIENWQNFTINKNCQNAVLSLHENRLWYRNMFAKKILMLMTNRNYDSANVDMKFNESLAHISLEIAQAALKINNNSVAYKYIRIFNNAQFSEKIGLQHKLIKSKLFLIHTQTKPERVNSLLKKSWTILSTNCFDTDPELHIQCWIQKYELFKVIHQCIEQNIPISESDIYDRFVNSDNSTVHNEILNCLHQAENVCIMCIEQSQNNQKNKNALIEIYIEIIKYCQKIEMNDDQRIQLIQAIFRCMKLGSNRAVQLFPYLLLDFENYSDVVKQSFINASEDVPIWMFLNWIPQLLVALNRQNSNIFHGILSKIASLYPNAMCFAYRLSRDNLLGKNIDNNEFLKRMDKIFLKDEEMNAFLQAIANVNMPEVIILHHVKKLKTAIQKSPNIKFLRKEFDKFHNDLADISKEFRDVPLFGDRFKHNEEYIEAMNLLFTSDKTPKEINSELTRLYNTVRGNIENKITSDKNLDSYSPWLANFEKIKLYKVIEIPGQYSSRRKPLPQYHININSFKKHISFMPSLRKPVKLIIIGSDGKEYPFLIKFGEDLRQDQRIQQLFHTINNFLQNDPNNFNKMAINTYQVIPLSGRFGMIQWLENTQSLLDFGFKYNESKLLLRNIQTQYRQWIESVTNSGGLVQHDFYQLASVHYNRSITTGKYNEFKSQLPWDLFRNALIELSSSKENFYFTRHEFGKSYAVQAIAHWILGIGDRHLSNTLLNLKNGQVIGIDFGHAFGTATQMLHVPELVPFRLTPQILNILKPFDETGLLKQNMLKTLKAMRLNQDIFILLLNVFIEEPIVDWLEAANSQFSNTPETIEWYPRKKVELARRKICGANPVAITIDELNDNRNVKHKDGYLSIVRGDPQVDVRAKEAEDNLSIEAQLECLLNQATDPNILGRMYCYWNPFV